MFPTSNTQISLEFQVSGIWIDSENKHLCRAAVRIQDYQQNPYSPSIFTYFFHRHRTDTQLRMLGWVFPSLAGSLCYVAISANFLQLGHSSHEKAGRCDSVRQTEKHHVTCYIFICKSLWIKASAKCININININLTLVNVLIGKYTFSLCYRSLNQSPSLGHVTSNGVCFRENVVKLHWNLSFDGNSSFLSLAVQQEWDHLRLIKSWILSRVLTRSPGVQSIVELSENFPFIIESELTRLLLHPAAQIINDRDCAPSTVFIQTHMIPQSKITEMQTDTTQ